MCKFNENGLNVCFQILFNANKDNKNSNIIFEKEKCYRIPIYQRPYSWQENQIVKLIDDIIESYETNSDKAMFLSTIQLVKNKNELSDIYDIIDGQQRLTTLYLILLKLYEKIESKDFPIFNLDLGEPNNIYFKNNEKNMLVDIKEEIHNKNLFNNLYAINFQIISNNIEVILEEKQTDIQLYVKNLIKYICEHINFIVFVIDGEKYGTSNIIKMFNTLNTTGLDLNVTDLFKINFAEMCKKIKNEKEVYVDYIVKKINSIYEKVSSAGLSSIEVLRLYQDIICTYSSGEKGIRYENGLKMSQDLFFENLFSNKNDLLKNNNIEKILSIEEFEKISQLFIDFEKFYRKYQVAETKYYSYDILTNTRYRRFWTFPFIYSYYNGYNMDENNESLFIKALEVTEELDKLLVIWSINQDRVVYEMQNFIAEYVYNKKNIEKKEDLVELIRKMKNKNKAWWANGEYKSKNVFEERIKYNLNNKWLICLLCELLDVVNSENGNNKSVLKNFHNMIFNPKDDNGNIDLTLRPDVEHIFARALFNNWNEEDKKMAEGIGNIMFLEGKINKSIQDKLVEEKEKKYKKSNFSMPEFNHNITAWSNGELVKIEIKNRGNKLAEQIINYIDF